MILGVNRFMNKAMNRLGADLSSILFNSLFGFDLWMIRKWMFGLNVFLMKRYGFMIWFLFVRIYNLFIRI